MGSYRTSDDCSQHYVCFNDCSKQSRPLFGGWFTQLGTLTKNMSNVANDCSKLQNPHQYKYFVEPFSETLDDDHLEQSTI